MKKTINVTAPYKGKLEITAQDAIQILHDSMSYYPIESYIVDIMREFEATRDEAVKEVGEFFKINIQ